MNGHGSRGPVFRDGGGGGCLIAAVTILLLVVSLAIAGPGNGQGEGEGIWFKSSLPVVWIIWKVPVKHYVGLDGQRCDR